MSITFTRGLLGVAAVGDLAGSLLMLTSYHSHAADATLLLDVALTMQLLHAFSWFGALLFSSGSLGRSFGQMMLATYVFVFLLDVASYGVRFAAPRDSLFVSVTFWTALALAIDAGVAALFTWLSITTAPAEEDPGPRKPWTQTLQRQLLPWLWIAEIVFGALQLGFWAGGLTRSPAFARLVLFEAPHVFLWLLHRAITGGLVIDDGVRKPGWIWLGKFVSALVALAGAAATALRLYYLFSDADEPAALLTTLPKVWGWLSFGFGAALLFVSFAQLILLESVMSNERRKVAAELTDVLESR
jgi:hypothetical protein